MKFVDLDDPKVVHLLCNLEPKRKPMAELHDGDLQDLGSVIEELCKLAVHAIPVRHGRWIDVNSPFIQEGAYKRKCTCCGEHTTNIGEPLNYCPNCGAKMEI